jgi:predicted NAD/FAD-dependent oxidoreductase
MANVKPNKDLPTVAVIGAGISGMVCARYLAEHGYPVTVFDKEKETGGRTSIQQEEKLTFDHGCPSFFAQDKKFQGQVASWVKEGVVNVWPAKRASCLHGTVHAVEDDTVLYVGMPGMNAISRHLGTGLDVRQDTIVSTIKRTNNSWKLLAGGKRESYDVLIVSAPAAQTAELLKGFPSIADDAAKAKMHPCWSATFGFDYNLPVTFDAAHFTSCPIIWAANNRTKPGRARDECWTIHASPSWSREHISSPEDMVGKIMLSSFFEASGIPPATPSFMRTYRWYYGLPAEPLHKGCLWDKEKWVGACGDWCHSARVEGAFISGSRMAETVMKDCPRLLQPVK